MQPPILEARGLMKRYGKTQALAGLDLVVNPGRVVALLGPNGAGNSLFCASHDAEADPSATEPGDKGRQITTHAPSVSGVKP